MSELNVKAGQGEAGAGEINLREPGGQVRGC